MCSQAPFGPPVPSLPLVRPTQHVSSFLQSALVGLGAPAAPSPLPPELLPPALLPPELLPPLSPGEPASLVLPVSPVLESPAAELSAPPLLLPSPALESPAPLLPAEPGELLSELPQPTVTDTASRLKIRAIDLFMGFLCLRVIRLSKRARPGH